MSNSSSPEEDRGIDLLDRLSDGGSIGLLSPESSAQSSVIRCSGSEGYLADDDGGDLSSTVMDDSDDEQLLLQNSRDTCTSISTGRRQTGK